MIANLKVGKTFDAFTNFTTPLTPQTPFAPWGVSPQAKRLLHSQMLATKRIIQLIYIL